MVGGGNACVYILLVCFFFHRIDPHDLFVCGFEMIFVCENEKALNKKKKKKKIQRFKNKQKHIFHVFFFFFFSLFEFQCDCDVIWNRGFFTINEISPFVSNVLALAMNIGNRLEM